MGFVRTDQERALGLAFRQPTDEELRAMYGPAAQQIRKHLEGARRPLDEVPRRVWIDWSTDPASVLTDGPPLMDEATEYVKASDHAKLEQIVREQQAHAAQLTARLAKACEPEWFSDNDGNAFEDEDGYLQEHFYAPGDVFMLHGCRGTGARYYRVLPDHDDSEEPGGIAPIDHETYLRERAPNQE